MMVGAIEYRTRDSDGVADLVAVNAPDDLSEVKMDRFVVEEFMTECLAEPWLSRRQGRLRDAQSIERG